MGELNAHTGEREPTGTTRLISEAEIRHRQDAVGLKCCDCGDTWPCLTRRLAFALWQRTQTERARAEIAAQDPRGTLTYSVPQPDGSRTKYVVRRTPRSFCD